MAALNGSGAASWETNRALRPRKIASGPFRPEWESLKQYRAPEWFREAKFGVWAHWSAQCFPEQGDWYARNMYIQGHPHYEFQVNNYGHPSKFGFMQIDHLWKAERWEPEKLMDLYVKAGARYFFTLANHVDNFDCYDSRHNPWNSTRIGPRKDIVGTWAKLARERGLRLGVSNHSAHAWHWLQTAYGYDPEGPMAGIRYDAYTLQKSDGRNLWWDGMDPQELYGGRNMVMPTGIRTIKEANQWHQHNDLVWNEAPPENNQEYIDRWFLRCQDLIDGYNPDLVYFDDTELPLGQAGLDITAHYYNQNIARHEGNLEGVVTAKNFTPQHLGAAVVDIERGRANEILPAPWQTDTCIGDWHYSRPLFERHGYKCVSKIVQTLVDVASKNGNLLLNIPVRGDGTIDEDEHRFLADLSSWMNTNSEAIYGTRPFAVFGEGPPEVADSSMFNESQARPYDERDIRFTQKGETLYAFAMVWPRDGKVRMASLGTKSTLRKRPIRQVELLGSAGTLTFEQGEEQLTVTLPPAPPHDLGAYAMPWCDGTLVTTRGVPKPSCQRALTPGAEIFSAARKIDLSHA